MTTGYVKINAPKMVNKLWVIVLFSHTKEIKKVAMPTTTFRA
jgi:hypothetical protein